MQLTAEERHGAVIVAPAGRIDHASADAFAAALEPYLLRCRTGEAPLVLDLSGVQYVSSAGLRVLMLAAQQAERQGGRIAAAALPPMVREVFEISRFDLVFPLYSNIDAALQALGARA